MIAATLTLSLLEIILLLFGAVILGITIHFFIASRRSLKETTEQMEKTSLARDEWKLRYFNDMELKEKELSSIKQQLQDADENTNIFTMEAEEMHRQNRRLEAELAAVKKAPPVTATIQHDEEITTLSNRLKQAEEDAALLLQEVQQVKSQKKKLEAEIEILHSALPAEEQPAGSDTTELTERLKEAEENAAALLKEVNAARIQNKKLEEEIDILHSTLPQQQHHEKEKPNNDYLDQLRLAQSSLIEHNQKINQLLGNIDIIKEKEEIQQEIMRSNEELSSQVDNMQVLLSEKEKEITTIRQKEHLTKEMTSMLDNAYSDFNLLQGKIQKLEAQLTSSKMMNLELEDLKEEHSKLTRDFDEQRNKATHFTTENQQLQIRLMETEDKLREANFQRQQLQKRVSYLEELNNDLQVVSDANKKLEGQLRRIGELESMLNVVSGERDQLVRQSGK